MNSSRGPALSLSKGFTLVEALVAMTILTVGLIPAFLQATSALQYMGQVRNTVVAAHLAQEGVEVISAIRDTNWFAGNVFDAGLTTCTAGCRVQYDSTVPIALGASPALNRNATSGLFQYAGGTPTGFTRTITITEPTTHEMKVVSVVTWTDHAVAKSFTVELYLFDWLK